MIYDSLDVLPVKTFYKIQQTGNYKLLNPQSENEEELKNLFDKFSDEFNQLDKGSSFEKDFLLQREIAHLEAKERLCILGVDILKFEYDQDVKNILEKEIHFKIRTKTTEYYYKDLERIEKKITLLRTKIERLKELQTFNKKDNADSSITIDDMLASVCTILGVSFDFNTIPCTTYIAYKKQTQSKIKVQEEQLRNLKSK